MAKKKTDKTRAAKASPKTAKAPSEATSKAAKAPAKAAKAPPRASKAGKATDAAGPSKSELRKSTGIEALAALDESFAAPLDCPVADLCHESRELEAVVAQMGEKLVAGSRLDASLCDALKPRRKLLEGTEQDWLAHRLSQSSSDRKDAQKKAEQLKKDLIAALRYFLHTSPAVQARVDDIIPGTGLADLIDDLSKLATLARENAASLRRADLPADAADQADLLAARLGDDEAVRSIAASDEGHSLMDLRNRAFWHLREAMDEIRAAGRYVFRNDPARLPLFRATGTRAHRSQSGKKPAPTTPVAAPTGR